jgi:Protein of unknown function (DUF2844)
MNCVRPSHLPRARRRLVNSFAGLSLLLLPAISLGALGASEPSVEADRAQFQASHLVRLMQLYTVHELTTPNGTTVREFVGADGAVFAVSWQGPLLPDLRLLLGKHFETLLSAERSQPATHSKLLLERPDVVIHSEGRVRAFSGRAWLPQLVPAGVDVTELR